MLAKPEYSSPLDEVCCWPRRRGGRAAAGLGTPLSRTLLAGALWQSCCWLGDATEQDAAGRGAVAERLQRGGAVVEMLAGAPWHSITLDEGAGADKHREAAVRSGKQLASGSSGARRAEAGGQKPAGVQLFCVTAVVPTVGAELAFWQAYSCYKVFQSLELERCELHVFAHYVYHLFVLCAVAVHILLKYLL